MKTNYLFAALVVPFWVLGQSVDPEAYELRWSRQYPNREIQLDYVSALDSTSFTTYGSISGGFFSKPKNFLPATTARPCPKSGSSKKSPKTTRVSP